MKFDKTAYMREYMRKKRAQQPTSSASRNRLALQQIREHLEGPTAHSFATIRTIVATALDGDTNAK